MKTLIADLHIHTCLSPCGELTMSPRAIVDAARRKGIQWIAITDHNSARMVDAVAAAATAAGIHFTFGMELQTREEVHLLAYFDTSSACHSFADAVYALLPDRCNQPDYFGDQVIVDAEETILGFEKRLLLNSVDLSIDEAVDRVRASGGLPVPAHVDRDVYSLISQLGVVPEGLTFDLVETISGSLPPGFGSAGPMCSSDAHEPDQIGRRTTAFRVEEATIGEMILAGRREGGRSATCRFA